MPATGSACWSWTRAACSAAIRRTLQQVGRPDSPRPQSSERRDLEHRQRGVLRARTRRRARNVARTMQNYVKRLDPTRPVTYAAPEGDVFRGINRVIEVRGWNYHSGPRHGQISRRTSRTSRTSAPSRPAPSARAAFTTNDRERGYVSAYDVRIGRAGATTPKAGGATSPTARGFPAVLSGPVLIIAASRRRIGGRASTRISAFSTRAVFRRTTFTITSRGGRRTPCCICCRTGTGQTRASKSRVGLSAIARRWNCSQRRQPGTTNR